MISQRPGDVLEVFYEDSWYYLVVITKIFAFGGNIIYAFHGDGEKLDGFVASPELSGFNICTDLLHPKKEGVVKRIGKVECPEDYLVTNLIKSCSEYRKGKKAKEWWLCTVEPPRKHVARVTRLTKKQSMAMDSGMFDFDLTASKIRESYTPNKNPFINHGLFGELFS